MLGFAHTRDLKFGSISKDFITQKDLMVMPNLPRFFREGDKITLSAKISSPVRKNLTGGAKLMLFDVANTKPVDSLFSNTSAEIPFNVIKGQSAPLSWNLSVPEGIGAITVRITAQSGNFTDGEEQTVPVLSNRMMVPKACRFPYEKKK